MVEYIDQVVVKVELRKKKYKIWILMIQSTLSMYYPKQ